jgi:hypothetical protein
MRVEDTWKPRVETPRRDWTDFRVVENGVVHSLDLAGGRKVRDDGAGGVERGADVPAAGKKMTGGRRSRYRVSTRWSLAC